MKSVQDSNEHMLGDISKMQGQITKAEAAYNDTAILIDSVKKVSDENSKKLETFLKEQATEKEQMHARVDKLEGGAASLQTKMDDVNNTLVETLDEVAELKNSTGKFTASMEEIKIENQRAVSFTKNVEKDLGELRGKFEKEMSTVAGTLEDARGMQEKLSEQLSRMTAAAEGSETMIDDLRAEQIVGIRRLEQRLDRVDVTIGLKATTADIVMLLGEKADRGVIEKLADERMAFLRQVSAQMNEVENKVTEKPDYEDLEVYVQEEVVTEMIQKTAADLTTFVETTVHDAVDSKADIADCKFLERRIKEVTGEIVEITNEDRAKVDARLQTLRSQVLTKADETAVKRMSKTVSALAHNTLQESSCDSAGLFFSCLSCGTTLPKLKGSHAVEALAGMIPQQQAAPAVGMLAETAETNEEVRALLREAVDDVYYGGGVVSQPVVDLPHASTGRRLLLTGSDGRLYKGAFMETE